MLEFNTRGKLFVQKVFQLRLKALPQYICYRRTDRETNTTDDNHSNCSTVSLVGVRSANNVVC